MKPATPTRMVWCGMLVAAAGAACSAPAEPASFPLVSSAFSLATTTSTVSEFEGDAVSSRRIMISGSYKVSSGGVGGSSAGEVTIRPVFALPSESRLIASPGDHLLEFFDGDGNVLSSVSFEPQTLVGDSVWKSWRVPVTEPSGWASYRVSKPAAEGSGSGGAEGSGSARAVLAEVTRSANAPTVSVIVPVAGQVFSGDEVTFSWTGSDPDGDDLSYSVAYSQDGGASYRAITGNYEATSLTMDRKWLAGSTTARIKVTARDGTRTASAESPIFTVSQNAPEVFIHNFTEGSIGGTEVLINDGTGALVLDATAYDAEDGRMDHPSAIQWVSDIDGNLGTGGHVIVHRRLTPGRHRLTVTATDSAGATGSAEVIWINAVPIAPTAPVPPAGAAAAGGNRSVTITWDPPSAELAGHYYQYRYRPTSGAWVPWAGLASADGSLTIGGLDSDTGYEIELRTANPAEVGKPVKVFAATDLAAPPP